jgi:hypothetical protein
MVEINGRFHGGPRSAVFGIPYFDDAFVCGENLGLGSLRA